MAAKYAIIEAMDKYEKIAQELGVSLKQIDTVLSLTAEGSTIPFIARYRKDLTGNLDEVAIKAIIDRDKSLTALAERKETVLAKIAEQGKLTDALKHAIEAAEKLADVEELYLPYMAAGGSSLIANYILATLLIIISNSDCDAVADALRG